MRFSILCTLALVGMASVSLDAQAFGKKRRGHCEQSQCGHASHYGQSQYGCHGGYATAGYSTGSFAMTYPHGTAMPMPLSTSGTVLNAAGQTTTTKDSGVVQASGTTTLSTTDMPMPTTMAMNNTAMDRQNYGDYDNGGSRRHRRGIFRR